MGRSPRAPLPQSAAASLRSSQGGVTGFFSYDLNKTLERLPRPAAQGQGFPQSVLGR
ncbi:hypothetical protein [Bradyrhizobium sp. CCBAU 25338]|uniref:hypothetical protein n=1 Tax=unclassified Bradyrhizobium TaxID=2631580 RepID=UPI003FA48787